jgi:hypothetical protein
VAGAVAEDEDVDVAGAVGVGEGEELAETEAGDRSKQNP